MAPSKETLTIPPLGVFVPVPTFFRPATGSESEAEVDIDAQVRHSIFLANSGITGLVLLGSTGEAIHLSSHERARLVASVKEGLEEAGFPDYPIMAGVLTNGIGETLDWLNDYAQAGAQWGLVLTPGYFGKAVTQQSIEEWYNRVAEKSPLPIVMYGPDPFHISTMSL